MDKIKKLQLELKKEVNPTKRIKLIKKINELKSNVDDIKK